MSINYKDVQFVFISNHYDFHLNGTCIHNHELCEFKVNYDSKEVTIHMLSLKQKIHWRCRQYLFEWCIGYHCSYPDRILGNVYARRKPRWLWEIIFKLYYKITV